MATIFLSQASSGAPALNGVNGALCSVLDWALVQNGWAIEYTATNARVYRAGTGNRFRLHVRHDSAISGNAGVATVRGAETATSATALGSPFPTVAQIANIYSTWAAGDTSNLGTAVDYKLIIGTTFVILLIKEDGNSSLNWGTYFFGDLSKIELADNYNTIITVKNSDSYGTTTSLFSANSIFTDLPVSSPTAIYWCRSVDGTIKSTCGYLKGSSSGTIGVTMGWGARQGYQSRLEREHLIVGCVGKAQPADPNNPNLWVTRRAYVPHIYNPLHSTIGGLTYETVFTDTAYNPSSTFRPISASTSWYLLEESNTWVAPT